MVSLNRFRVAVRLGMLALIFAVPFTTIIVYLILSGLNEFIHFADSEMKGNEYQRPLERILDLTQRRQLLQLEGKTDPKSIDAELAEALDSLIAVQERHGVALEFTSEGLRKRKREHLDPNRVVDLGRKLMQEARPDDAAYDSLVADIRGMIDHAGDTSKLILDPDLDSYYAMDITLLASPIIQNRCATILREAVALKKAGGGSPEAQQTFAVNIAMLRADLSRITDDVGKILTEDPNCYGRSESLQALLPPGLKSLQDEVNAFADAMANPATSIEELFRAGSNAREASFVFWKLCVTELDKLLVIRRANYQGKRTKSLAATALALVMSGLAAWLIGRSVTRTLRTISEELHASAATSASTASSVREFSEAISESAQKQASALQQTTSAAHELATIAEDNLAAVRNVNQSASRTRAASDTGAGDLGRLVAMLSELRSESTEITRILKTVDEIAFQTNILALNAAVEAARAGTAGAGFAVVADEVRALAQRSASAARETTERLGGTMEKTVRSAELAEHLQARLADITREARTLDELAAAVIRSCEEQTKGVKEMSGALEHLDEETQSTAAKSQDAAESARALDQQSVRMDRSVSRLSGMIHGAEKSPPKSLSSRQSEKTLPERSESAVAVEA